MSIERVLKVFDRLSECAPLSRAAPVLVRHVCHPVFGSGCGGSSSREGRARWDALSRCASGVVRARSLAARPRSAAIAYRAPLRMASALVVPPLVLSIRSRCTNHDVIYATGQFGLLCAALSSFHQDPTAAVPAARGAGRKRDPDGDGSRVRDVSAQRWPGNTRAAALRITRGVHGGFPAVGEVSGGPRNPGVGAQGRQWRPGRHTMPAGRARNGNVTHGNTQQRELRTDGATRFLCVGRDPCRHAVVAQISAAMSPRPIIASE